MLRLLLADDPLELRASGRVIHVDVGEIDLRLVLLRGHAALIGDGTYDERVGR